MSLRQIGDFLLVIRHEFHNQVLQRLQRSDVGRTIRPWKNRLSRCSISLALPVRARLRRDPHGPEALVPGAPWGCSAGVAG